MKLTAPQKEELLRLIKEKPKSMRGFCEHYGVTIQEAQRYMRMDTVKKLKQAYAKENN